MASRAIGDLSAPMQLLCQRHLDRCRRDPELQRKSVSVFLTCTFRDDSEQARLYAQGRDPAVPGPIVTNAKAGQSAHNLKDSGGRPCAEAYDLAITEAGKLVWDDHAAWELIGAHGIAAGLKWYGSPGARFPEKPHFQNPAV